MSYVIITKEKLVIGESLPMTKFCIYCGKPLQENEVCLCKPKQTPPPVPPEINPGQFNGPGQDMNMNYGPSSCNPAGFQQAGPSPYQEKFMALTKRAGSYLKRLFAQFKSILKAPATGGHTFMETANIKMALGLVALQAILSALFAAAFFQKGGRLLYSSFGKINGIFGHILGQLKVSLLTLFLSLFLSAALAASLYAAAKLMKSQVTYRQMFCLVAIKCTITAPMLMVSIVLLFLNLFIGTVLYYLALAIGFLVIAMYFNHVAKLDANRIIWIVAGGLTLYSVISCIVLKHTVWLYLPSGYMDYFGGILNIADYLELFLKLG